ncbi:hypothetical protein A6R68_09322, partial [Neotoma lepida]
MATWSLRRRPGRTLGLLLLLILSFLVLRRHVQSCGMIGRTDLHIPLQTPPLLFSRFSTFPPKLEVSCSAESVFGAHAKHQLALPLQWCPAREVVLKKVTCQGLAKWEGGSFAWPPWEQVKERKQRTCEGEKDEPQRLGLRTKGSDFVLEDSTFQIFGGSIHYFRVPREYWRDRLLKMKACGLNTLTTYVPWNLHEPERGKFDFSWNLDLEAFIQLAAKIGLYVILRPGPYICSEIDLGGLPSWLLQDPDMKLRTTYRGFTKAYKHGGPIIAVQVENEYGSYNKDRAYMPYIKKALEDRGIIEMLLTSDNKDGLQKGVVDGVPGMVACENERWVDGEEKALIYSKRMLATINLQSQQELKALNSVLVSIQLSGFNENDLNKVLFEKYLMVRGIQPKMVMEYWTGWFDSWGGSHNILDSSDLELGAAWPLRFLPFHSEIPVNMENLPVNNGNGQAFGYVLYETTIFSSGVLSGLVRDRGQVFLNRVSIGFLDYKTTKITVPLTQGYSILSILVENRGRVNYGNNIDTQRKGLIGNLYLNNNPLKDFKIYSLDMTKKFFQRFNADKWSLIPKEPTFPAFFLGALSVDIYPSDTFLKLEFLGAPSPVGLNGVLCNTWDQRPPCLSVLPHMIGTLQLLCGRG